MLVAAGMLFVVVGIVLGVVGRIFHFYNIESFGDKTAGLGVVLSIIGMLLR